MSVTQKIIIVPNEAGAFLPVQRAALTAIKELCRDRVKAKIESTDGIYNPAQLHLRSRDEQDFVSKHGYWKNTTVSSYDFESFSILFGLGDSSPRNVFTCETFDKYDGIPESEHKNICFLINEWGSYAEILDVIGEACLSFGQVFRVDNNNDIVKQYETKVSVDA